MASKREEVVVGPDQSKRLPEEFAPDACNQFFDGSPRRHVFMRSRTPLGFWEGLAVHRAIGLARELIEEHERGRDHGGRQPLAHVVAKVLCCERATLARCDRGLNRLHAPQ